jgi:DNA polymerase (family X)
MDNREIACVLYEVADLMEIAGEDGFRIRSYRNAAGVIEGWPERIADIARNPERKLTDVPGIGKGIGGVIQELLERGSFAKRDELLQKYSPGCLELLKVQGLGPKGIAVLYEHFRVSSIAELEKLCREQKLRTLPRMGARLEERVLQWIEQNRDTVTRFLLSFAETTAASAASYLLETEGVERVTPAGSLRRGKETVGDLDLLVTGPAATNALERFTSWCRVHDVIAMGGNKASARVGLEGIQVDVRALPPESFGAAMQYFTGSKDHNVALRQRALRLGLTLNEYGLFRLEGNERVAGTTEEEVYEALGMAWIPPELRENQGEIEAAAERRLPTLIEQRDLRGDLHMHTRETDGRATLEEMAAACRDIGYEYIAITDHSKSLAMSNGMDEQRVVEFAQRVRELNEDGMGIRVLSGIECDILRDGAMDLADDALAELDWVIGSVHSFFNLDHQEMTDRLLRALECRHLKVLGHLTGRRLLEREPYSFDFEGVATEAARRGIALEINSSPERLDIHAPLIRTAKAKGCRFTISTDAHHPNHLRNMRYGVLMARRGWLEPRDVLNTLPAAEFAAATRKQG